MLNGRLEKWIGKPWPPQMFGLWGGCCCTPGYHIRQYDNDSSMAVLAQQEDNRTCLGLMWDGTNLVSIYNTGSGPYLRAITYDSALATVRSTNHTYNLDQNSFPEKSRSVFLCGDGTYCMTASRTAAVNRPGAASVNSDDSADWETSIDLTASPVNEADCVVGDSSGNVYLAGRDTQSFVKTGAQLYKFNSSGVKQWVTDIDGAVGSAFRARLITEASDGYIWVSGNNGRLVRVSTGGTATTVANAPQDNSGNLESDGAGGVWVGGNGATWSIRRYDSSGTAGTVITDADLNISVTGGQLRPCFDVDSSNNVYAIVNSGGVWKVKMWDSSGSLQWTSGDIGWSGTAGPLAITVDATYIFVGGQYVS